jgi:hypothetical protein
VMEFIVSSIKSDPTSNHIFASGKRVLLRSYFATVKSFLFCPFSFIIIFYFSFLFLVMYTISFKFYFPSAELSWNGSYEK